MEINENEVYTSEEVLSLLKISRSTFLRLVRRGVLSAYKVGGQYRILGKEVLGLFSPRIQHKALRAYKYVKAGVKRKLSNVDKKSRVKE